MKGVAGAGAAPQTAGEAAGPAGRFLVSLHMPKTAGTSFLELLDRAYDGRVYRDYADRPLNRSPLQRCTRALGGFLENGLRPARLGDAACVHGHFLPLKYRLFARRRPVSFVAWFRDPVERLASHYHYWLRSYDPLDAGRLHRRVVEERWDLERFCLSPQLQNVYAKFLWHFPVERFDFLGITECFQDDLALFIDRYLGPGVSPPPARNVNSDGQGAAPGALRSYVTDSAFRRRVEAFHAADMQLYAAVLALREARGQRPPPRP